MIHEIEIKRYYIIILFGKDFFVDLKKQNTMGHEHDKWSLTCGCIEHFEYYEACGMGPVSGTEKRYTEECTYHGGTLPSKIQDSEADILSKEIKELESAISTLKQQVKNKQLALDKILLSKPVNRDHSPTRPLTH